MKSYDALSDAELLRRAKHDDDAFAEFYRRFAEPVYAATLRRVGNADVAVDITAETFAQALRVVGRFRGARAGSGGAWIHAVAESILNQYWRTERVERKARARLGIDDDSWNRHDDQDIERRLDALASGGKKVDAKRREAHGHAARADTCSKELAMIDLRSKRDQLTQIHLGAAHIAETAANNPHVYGVLADPGPIHDLITYPENHTRPLAVPALPGTLGGRLDAISAAGQAGLAAVHEPAIEPEQDDADETATGETAPPMHDDTAELTARLLASHSTKNGSSSAIAS